MISTQFENGPCSWTDLGFGPISLYLQYTKEGAEMSQQVPGMNCKANHPSNNSSEGVPQVVSSFPPPPKFYKLYDEASLVGIS